MKLLKIIKAFFTHENEPVELDLVAAEIKEGRAYLHPKGEEKITYLVKSDDIRIQLNNGRSLSPKDIVKIAPKPPKEQTVPKDPKNPKDSTAKPEKEKAPSAPPKKPTEPVFVQNTTKNEFDRYKKKTFTVSLYPEDYDALMASMKGYGYKRADFVMACVNSASKTNMERAHKKIQKANKMRKEEQRAMKEHQTTAEP